MKHESAPIPRLGALPSAALDTAAEALAELNLSPEAAATQTTQAFSDGVLSNFRAGILKVLASRGGDFIGIGEALKLHRSVPWRWEQGTTIPSFENLFLAGVALRAEWGSAFPHHSAAIMSGVCFALSHIRSVIFNDSSEECDPAAVVLMWYITLTPQWRMAIESNSRSRVERASSDATIFVSQYLRKKVMWSEADVLKLIDTWFNAYVLFHLCIKFDWQM